MIPVAELDRIARARLEDAEALREAGRYDGAAYLCGYAVEVALKARISRTLNWPDFPSTSGEFRNYTSFQTHDLDVLLRLSGQEARIKGQHLKLWSEVVRWKAEWRYNVIRTMEGPGDLLGAMYHIEKGYEAEAMIQAAEALLQIL